MAIDTRDKRAAALDFDQPWSGHILPNPDAAAEDQADRQQMAAMYPGILAGAPVTPTGGLVYVPIFRPRRR